MEKLDALVQKNKNVLMELCQSWKNKSSLLLLPEPEGKVVASNTEEIYHAVSKLKSNTTILIKGGIHFTGLGVRYQQFAYMASGKYIPPVLKACKIKAHELLMFCG